MVDFEQVMTALEQRAFSKAAHLLQTWKQQNPQDPWLSLAAGRYFEATGAVDKAETAYRRLLQQSTHAKIIPQARQGIQRLRDEQARRQEQMLTQVKAQPGGTQPALLLLDPVQGEARQAAAMGIAKVLQVDPYTARLLVPGQYWRLHRVGPAGEVQYLCQQLQAHQTPAYWVPLSRIKDLQVFRGQYLQTLQPEVKVVCQDGAGQLGTIAFDWPEVSQWVLGQLPIFESVVDLGPWGKLKRKEVTQDYSEVIDLHLHRRGCILRFCDRTYQYRQGSAGLMAMGTDRTSPPPNTQPISWVVWNRWKQILAEQVQGPCWKDFNGFGETALEYLNLLPDFPTHLDLIRRQPSPWDAAFQLYSGLRFLRYFDSI